MYFGFWTGGGILEGKQLKRLGFLGYIGMCILISLDLAETQMLVDTFRISVN